MWAEIRFLEVSCMKSTIFCGSMQKATNDLKILMKFWKRREIRKGNELASQGKRKQRILKKKESRKRKIKELRRAQLRQNDSDSESSESQPQLLLNLVEVNPSLPVIKKLGSTFYLQKKV